MDYFFSATINDNFENAIQKVTRELKAEGFGVLTEIDLKSSLKKRPGMDVYNYRILGACNPAAAFKGIHAEDKAGTMLSCNVIVQEKIPGKIEVSAVDPVASMMAIKNPKLGEIAAGIRIKLQRVINHLNHI